MGSSRFEIRVRLEGEAKRGDETKSEAVKLLSGLYAAVFMCLSFRVLHLVYRESYGSYKNHLSVSRSHRVLNADVCSSPKVNYTWNKVRLAWFTSFAPTVLTIWR